MENNEVVQIDLKNLVRIIMSNIMVIISVTVIFAALSLIYTKCCIPKKYTSSVSLYVMNNKVTQNTGEILSSDISASQMLVNTYSVILSDNLVMEDIGKKLIEKYGAENLENVFPVIDGESGKSIPAASIAECISMGAVNDTEVLQVTATTKDPQVSVDVCLAMTEIAPKVLANIMGVAYVSPIGYPELPAGNSSPNVLKNVILGGIFGIIISAGFVIFLKLINNTITDGESLRNRFSIPILGEIPIYEVSEANKEISEKGVKSND